MLSDPFDSFAADMTATFRVQREWAQRRGLMLITAHFLTGIGGGAWIVGAFAHYRPSLYVGLVLAMIGGLFHLGFLGHAERFWRMVTAFRTSWISRGLVGVGLFSVSAILYLLVSADAETDLLSQSLLYISLIGAAWICVYKGFVWASAKGVPFWNSALLPAVFIAYALRGGIAILFVGLLVSAPSVDALNLWEVIKLWIGISSAALVILYLAAMPNTGVAAQRSVSSLVKGRLSLAFYVGAVFFGLVVPIALGAYSYSSSVELSNTWIGLIGLSSIIGDFYTILSIARAGIYRPLAIFN